MLALSDITAASSNRALQRVHLTPKLLSALRQRQQSGDAHKGNAPIYRDGNLLVRATTRSITLCTQVYCRVRKSPRYVTLATIPVQSREPIDQKTLDLATANMVKERDIASGLQVGLVKDAIDAKLNRSKTCRELFDVYCSIPSVTSLRSFAEIKSYIERFFLAAPLSKATRFEHVAPSYFSKMEAQAWMDSVARRSGNATARKVRAYVLSMFNTLVKNSALSDADVFPKVRRIEPNAPRESFMTPAQIRCFWKATESLKPIHRDFAQMMLLSAQRENQILQLRWAWIDFEERSILFPAAVMKGKKPSDFRLPITDPMLEILDRRLAENEWLPPERQSEFVFPAANGGPMGGMTALTLKLDKLMGAAPPTSRKRQPRFWWRWHDMRRTAVRLLENSRDPIADSLTTAQLALILAHKQVATGQALRAYSQGRLERQKLVLMNLLGKEIMLIVGYSGPQSHPVMSR